MLTVGNVLAGARARHGAMLGRIEELVTQESPPGCRPELEACADLLEDWGTDALDRSGRRVTVDGVPHLLWPAHEQDVLLVGHFDTVWPAGTIDDWPFRISGSRATGPGVCDMKAGIVMLLTALELIEDTSRVGVLLTGDEETGSVTSRPIIEAEARRSGAVLVCEPSTESGELKIARKGGSAYQIRIRGRAAHAGVEPHRGVNAAVELAHQVLGVSAFAADGTSVTPTVLSAGVLSNVVPEEAVVAVDVRAWSSDELTRVDRLMRGLTPRLSEASLRIEGGIHRQPLLASVSRSLFEQASAAARELGLAPVAGVAAPGASDANFTGALGVPTLDGLGAVGGGSHARSEYVDISRLADRTALLAALLRRVPRRERIPLVSMHAGPAPGRGRRGVPGR